MLSLGVLYGIILVKKGLFYMNKKISFFIISAFVCVTANAEYMALDDALRATYASCVGIDEALHDMKVRAGINTAVTGVGTVAGGAALVVGIKKKNLMNTLRDIEDNGQELQSSYNNLTIEQNVNFKPNLKSKKLGNWRTGLLAANTATNVAGAVIAAKNAHNDDLESQIAECSAAVDDLKNALVRANFDNIDTTEASAIYDACSGYKYIDYSVLKKRAKGAEISSIVGGSTSAVGIITSAVANKSDGEKEKKLDTASNVLAGGATVFTGTATVFNAMQISAIKKIADTAQLCESLLK